MHVQITKKTVETIETPESRELLLRDTELKGFGVRISPTGAKTFFAEGNFKRSRQTKRLTLGRYPVISVDVARSKAREVLYQWYVGIDPRLEERRQQEADIQKNAHEKARVITLSEIVDRYFSNRSLKSEEEYRKVLRRIFGDWMERSLQEITRQDVEDRYCQIALTRGHRAQANKAMRYLSSILNFALAESIEGTPLLRNNPVKVLSDKKYDRSTKAKKTFLELH